MGNSKDYEIIGYQLFDPTRLSSKNTKASLTTYECSNTSCPLRASGSCVMVNPINSTSCEYGRVRKEEGYTQRAMNFGDWMEEAKESVSSVGRLEGARVCLAEVGDMIYFPYPHWYLLFQQGHPLHGGFLRSVMWIPKAMFTPALIHRILTGKPQAMLGGTIRKYQKVIVPRISQHLKENMPDLWAEVCREYPEFMDIVNNAPVVGRLAVASTLRVGCSITNGFGDYVWDGEYFCATNSTTGFLPIRHSGEVRFRPAEGATFKITSEDQIDKNTRFVE